MGNPDSEPNFSDDQYEASLIDPSDYNMGSAPVRTTPPSESQVSHVAMENVSVEITQPQRSISELHRQKLGRMARVAQAISKHSRHEKEWHERLKGFPEQSVQAQADNKTSLTTNIAQGIARHSDTARIGRSRFFDRVDRMLPEDHRRDQRVIAHEVPALRHSLGLTRETVFAEGDQRRDWKAELHPANVATLRNYIVATIVKQGINEKSARFVVRTSGINKVTPDIVADYLGVDVTELGKARRGEPSAIPPQVINQLNAMIKVAGDESEGLYKTDGSRGPILDRISFKEGYDATPVTRMMQEKRMVKGNAPVEYIARSSAAARRRSPRGPLDDIPERISRESKKSPEQILYEKGLAQFNHTLEAIDRLQNDPVYGTLVVDRSTLTALHHAIQDEAWPLYTQRMEELNAEIEEANKSLSDDKKRPLIESPDKLPSGEKRPIIDPIDESYTREYVKQMLPQGTPVSNDILRLVTMARLHAVGKLKEPKKPKTI